MDNLKTLHWPLILVLGGLALARPLTRIVEDQSGVSGGPAVPIILTVIISIIWITVVGLSRTAHPVLTLACAGTVYAVFSMLLSAILSPLLTGTLQGPLANPIAIVPMLLINVVWGSAAGLIALLLQRARGLGRTA